MVAKSARTYQKNEKVVIKKRPFIIQGTCYGAFTKEEIQTKKKRTGKYIGVKGSDDE